MATGARTSPATIVDRTAGCAAASPPPIAVGCATIRAWRSSSPSPTSPRAAGSRWSTASPRRWSRCPAPTSWIGPATRPTTGASSRSPARRPRSPTRWSGWWPSPSARSTWRSSPASTPGSARSTSSRSCRSATRRWRSASASPATSGGGSRPASTCPSTSTRPPRRGPIGSSWPTCAAASTRACATEIATRGREPDFGPARTHPRGGATCVGARPFLIAWNINLASDDLELAKRIAHRIRESSGGLPAVQAKGFFIEELGCAQVSMNLLDFARTPLWAAWEMVRAEAAEDGVELAEIRADRAGAAGRIPGRRRPRRRARARRRRRSGSSPRAAS